MHREGTCPDSVSPPRRIPHSKQRSTDLRRSSESACPSNPVAPESLDRFVASTRRPDQLQRVEQSLPSHPVSTELVQRWASPVESLQFRMKGWVGRPVAGSCCHCREIVNRRRDSLMVGPFGEEMRCEAAGQCSSPRRQKVQGRMNHRSSGIRKSHLSIRPSRSSREGS